LRVGQVLVALAASSTGVSLLQSLPREQRVDGTFVALELVRCIPNGASIFTRDFTLWLPLLWHIRTPNDNLEGETFFTEMEPEDGLEGPARFAYSYGSAAVELRLDSS